MRDKLINDISDRFIYVDKDSDSPFKYILEKKSYKSFIYLKDDSTNFTKGTIVIADSIDDGIIYWGDFEDMIKPEFRN